MLEERYTEIERENRILLEKMTNILQNPKGISHANNFPSSTNNLPPITTGQISQISVQNKKSLNKELRKKELVKIT